MADLLSLLKKIGAELEGELDGCNCANCFSDSNHTVQLGISYTPHPGEKYKGVTIEINADSANGVYIDRPDVNNPGFYIRMLMIGVPCELNKGIITILKFERGKETLFRIRYITEIKNIEGKTSIGVPQFEILDSVYKQYNGRLDHSLLGVTGSAVGNIRDFIVAKNIDDLSDIANAQKTLINNIIGFAKQSEFVLIIKAVLDPILVFKPSDQFNTRMIAVMLDKIFGSPFGALSITGIFGPLKLEEATTGKSVQIKAEIASISADSVLKAGANKNGINELTATSLKSFKKYLSLYRLGHFYIACMFWLKEINTSVEVMVKRAALFLSKNIVGKPYFTETCDVIDEVD